MTSCGPVDIDHSPHIDSTGVITVHVSVELSHNGSRTMEGEEDGDLDYMSDAFINAAVAAAPVAPAAGKSRSSNRGGGAHHSSQQPHPPLLSKKRIAALMTTTMEEAMAVPIDASNKYDTPPVPYTALRCLRDCVLVCIARDQFAWRSVWLCCLYCLCCESTWVHEG